MNWKPGDMAVIRGAAPPNDDCEGSTLMVLSFPVACNCGCGDDIVETDLPPPSKVVTPILYPIDNEKGSWEDCVFKPKVLEVMRVE